MIQTFLIISSSKERLQKEVEKLLAPLHIDAFDIHRIKPENSIGIEEIRKLKLMISLKPFRSQTKAVVIEEAQKLTIEAQNALLKTLEEPPDHTIIILLVEGNIDILLPTVVSRCQVVEISNIKYQISNISNKELLTINSQLSLLLSSGTGEKLALAEEWAKDKEIALSWLSNMIHSTRQKLLKEVSNDQNHLLISNHLNILISLQKAHALLTTTNVNPRFTLENLFLAL